MLRGRLNCFFFIYFMVFSFVELAGLESKPTLPPYIKTGVLPNGVPYFIQQNPKPAQRVELRLVIRVGSALEEDHERGIAHLLEHMQFNGTQNFKPKEIVDFLESIGMRFGADLNASTSFNSTQYYFQVPTDKKDYLKKACLILNDWAHGPVIDPVLLEREKKVVEEERRVRGESVDGRAMDFFFQRLFDGTVYAHRLPIGTTPVITGATPELVLGFARKWYMPANMAVIAVGDIDPHEIERFLMESFTQPFPETGLHAPSFTKLPLLTEKQAYFFRDKELSSNEMILVNFGKKTNDPENFLQEELFSDIAFSLINQDLRRLSLQADPAFISAEIGNWLSLADIDSLGFFMTLSSGQILQGWTAALEEIRRAILHGFAEEDFARARAEYLSKIEKYYTQRESIGHTRRAWALADYYLNDDFVFDDTILYEKQKTLAYALEPQTVHKWFVSKFSLDHFKLFCLNIDQPDNPDPTSADLLSSIDQVAKAYVPQKTSVAVKPLFEKEPNPGTIVSVLSIPEIEAKLWELSNGVKVYLKPNTLDKNEVLVDAFAPGGLSLVDDKDYEEASFASNIFSQTGLGDLDWQELAAFSSGKQAAIYEYMDQNSVGFSGSSTRTDLLALFQLIYWRLNVVRRDPAVEAGIQKKLVEAVKNSENLPTTIFDNEIKSLLMNFHPYSKPISSDQVAKLNLDAMARIYERFFTNASAFTFVIAGDFDEKELQSLVCTYLASLPKGTKTVFKDLGIRPFSGPLRRDIKKGVDQKATIKHMITREKLFEPRDRLTAKVLNNILDIRLFEAIREALGGSYGVRVDLAISFVPYTSSLVSCSYTCDLVRQEEIIKAVTDELQAIREGKIDQIVFAKAIEMEIKKLQNQEKMNYYWKAAISDCLFDGQEVREIPHRSAYFQNLTLADVKALATDVLITDKMITVTLNPE